MASLLKALCLALIAAVLIATPTESALSCGSVVQYLNPCIPYVIGYGPLVECCDGIRGLYAAAKTTPDRQAVCKCLKSEASNYPGIPLGKAFQLPQKCGVQIPGNIKLSPNIDCSIVK